MPQPAISSYLNAGLALTAAAAIALTPSMIPEKPAPVTIPTVTAPDVRLTVSPADIEAFTANVQAVLDDATGTVQGLAGIPGQTLIGLVNNNILTLIDNVFTGVIGATDNPTLVESLTILKTLTYDAYVMLGVNLGRINPVITATTGQVGELLTSALTGSLQNILIAVANVANDPLSPGSYAGLLAAGVASGQLLAGNGLRAIQTVGDGGFEIVGIALDEVTFQFNNAVSGLSALATQLGDASGNAIVEAVIGAVRGLAVTPAVAAFDFGSSTIGTVLTTANAGLDLVLNGATSIVKPTVDALESTSGRRDPTVANSAVAEPVRATLLTLTTGEPDAQPDEVAGIVSAEPSAKGALEEPSVGDDEPTGAEAAAAEQAAPDKGASGESDPIASGHRPRPSHPLTRRALTSRGPFDADTTDNTHGDDGGSATDHTSRQSARDDNESRGSSETGDSRAAA